jgi:hypothetical protein
MGEAFVEWPFTVLKPEASWSEEDRDFIDFMRVAHAEGFRPRHCGGSPIDAGEPGGRYASLIRRGSRNGWEPWLCDGDRCARLGTHYNLPLGDLACVCVRPPFRAAAHLALEWLRGRELNSLLQDFEFVDGRQPGIVLGAQLVARSPAHQDPRILG